jgi:hypothetical protein
MKGMRDPKLLGLCSTNGCSPTGLSLNSSTLRIRFELQGRAGPKRISPYPPQSDRRPNGPCAFQVDSQTGNPRPRSKGEVKTGTLKNQRVRHAAGHIGKANEASILLRTPATPQPNRYFLSRSRLYENPAYVFMCSVTTCSNLKFEGF